MDYLTEPHFLPYSPKLWLCWVHMGENLVKSLRVTHREINQLRLLRNELHIIQENYQTIRKWKELRVKSSWIGLCDAPWCCRSASAAVFTEESLSKTGLWSERGKTTPRSAGLIPGTRTIWIMSTTRQNYLVTKCWDWLYPFLLMVIYCSMPFWNFLINSRMDLSKSSELRQGGKKHSLSNIFSEIHRTLMHLDAQTIVCLIARHKQSSGQHW